MNKLIHNSIRIMIIGIMIWLSLCGCNKAGKTSQDSPFPISTPEEQGMDSQALIEILDTIESGKHDMHSLLVLRNGKLVMEVYFPPFTAQDKQTLYSVTKSFISALVGIAIGEGKIKSVDQPILDFFQNKTIQNLDEKKQNIRIQHLLNMTSGLLDDEIAISLDLDSVLNRVMVRKPGEKFYYTDGNPHLLSVILQKATGKTASEYAQEKLFDPLGIQNAYWQKDEKGVTMGGSGLILTPRDLAKFGLLYLNRGLWEGKQIVPADWIEETGQKNENYYSYLWWQHPNAFFAFGYSGQMIYVNPTLKVVVVATANIPDTTRFDISSVVAAQIPKALKSDQPLPKSTATRDLENRIKQIENPKAELVAELPEIASTIDGITVHLEENALGWETARLEFEKDHARLTVTTTASQEEKTYTIGLDGLYRRTEISASEQQTPGTGQDKPLGLYESTFLHKTPVNGFVAMKGKWINENMFKVTVDDLRQYDRTTLNFQFSPPNVNISWMAVINQIILTLKGTLK